ncbi:unnamed protein product [Calypogeia fissa]
MRGLLVEETLVTNVIRRPLHLELTNKHMATKFKTWFYVCCRRGGDAESLAFELHNCAYHWARIHTTCMMLSDQPCHHIGEEGVTQPKVYYDPHSLTHKAMKAFMAKKIIVNKMRFYTRARENFMSETFHSVMEKYATKRIHFPASHEARLFCAGMDWNENIGQDV